MNKFKFLGRSVLGLTGNKGSSSRKPSAQNTTPPSASASSLPRDASKHTAGGECAQPTSRSVVSMTSSEASFESGRREETVAQGGGRASSSAASGEERGLLGLLEAAVRKGQQQLEQLEGSSRATKLRKRLGDVCSRTLDMVGDMERMVPSEDDRMEAVRHAVSTACGDIAKACNASTIAARKAKGHASRSVQEAEEAVDLLEQATGRLGKGAASKKGGCSPGGKSSEGVYVNSSSPGGSPLSTSHPGVKFNSIAKSNDKTDAITARHLPPAPPPPETNSPSGSRQEPQASAPSLDPDHLYLEAEASLSLADCDVAAPANYKRARTLFEAAAKGGHARGMLRYGQCLSQGLGGPKDLAEGRVWVTRSAVEGEEEAECEVALLKEQSQGPQAAIPLLQSLVSKGNTGACVRLAELMLSGDCDGDESMAESLLVKAGEAGDGWAWNRVGVMRKLRIPPPQPGEGSAMAALEKGCALGCRDAMNNMGVLCEDSDPPDFAGACRWYAKAAALGHLEAVNHWGYALLVHGDAQGAVAKFEEAVRRGCGGDAQFNLASVLEHGSGCFKDEQRAKRLYMDAAAKGCGKSAYRGGCLVYDEGDMAGALKLFKQSAASGNPRAMNALGVMMEAQGGGEGWYREASERGCAEAAYNMGLVCERDGREGAVEWFRKAHELGHGGAMAEVLRLEASSQGLEGRREDGDKDKGHYRDRLLYLGVGDDGGQQEGGAGGGYDPYAKFYDEILEGNLLVEDVVHTVQGGQVGAGGEDARVPKRKQKSSPSQGLDRDHTHALTLPQDDEEGYQTLGEGMAISHTPESKGSSLANSAKVGMKGLLGEARHLGDDQGVGRQGSEAVTPGGTVVRREPDGEKDEAVLRLLGAL